MRNVMKSQIRWAYEIYSTIDDIQKTPEFVEFTKNVNSIREVKNVTLIQPIKAYPSTR